MRRTTAVAHLTRAEEEKGGDDVPSGKARRERACGVRTLAGKVEGGLNRGDGGRSGRNLKGKGAAVMALMAGSFYSELSTKTALNGGERKGEGHVHAAEVIRGGEMNGEAVNEIGGDGV
jgi:hypothetical protein